jgi:predicted DNA-binding protein with PD1-like motif
MRTLLHSGPVHPRRIDSFTGIARTLTFPLRTGVPLLEAATEPLVNAGWRGGTLSFTGGAFNPFRYVMPGPPDDASHVAYFSAPKAPVGITRVEQANATFGWHDGAPFLHCHASWIEPDGARRGGHILTGETNVAETATVQAWGFSEIAVETSRDDETNFTLLQPSGFQPSGSPGLNGQAVFARVRPNEDIVTAVEAIARGHGIRDATIRGSVGSLIGAHFVDGTIIPDNATEVLVRSGHVRNGDAALDLLVVDALGQVHAGWLERGENPVCITFDLVLTSDCDHRDVA